MVSVILDNAREAPHGDFPQFFLQRAGGSADDFNVGGAVGSKVFGATVGNEGGGLVRVHGKQFDRLAFKDKRNFANYLRLFASDRFSTLYGCKNF